MDRKGVEDAIRQLLKAFGEDPDRQGLIETPKRVAGYWWELLEGSQYTNEEIARKFGKVFEVENQSLIIKDVDRVFSHCEHHLALMYNMTVRVAYLPSRKANGKYIVIGLSKIPRIVDMCAKRLQLQEKLTNDIAESISIATGSKDVYVRVKADHACVSARGAKAPGETVTTFLGGAFEENEGLLKRVEGNR